MQRELQEELAKETEIAAEETTPESENTEESAPVKPTAVDEEKTLSEEKPKRGTSKLEPTPLEASIMLLDAGVKSFEEAVHGIINAPKGRVRAMKDKEEMPTGCDFFSFWS